VDRRKMIHEFENVETAAIAIVEEWHQRYGHLPLPTLKHIEELLRLCTRCNYNVQHARKESLLKQ
jgi:hypothetical protein